MARRIVTLALLAFVVVACGGGESATSGTPTAAASSMPTATSAGLPTAATSPGQSPTPGAGPGWAASVARVVDGDTLKARIAGRTETIRVIGLDTPESVKPRTSVECYALRATAEADRLLPVGAPIRLEADPTQATRDQYGRLLAHVWLPDGTLYAERMIEGGFGIHYVYGGVPSIHARRLAAAEDAARTALRGLWSPATCGGNDHTAAP